MSDSFEAVVIGSGFGGTILALSFVNSFTAEKNSNKKVCVLERGQWWLSHEINFTPKAARADPGKSSNMREYLDDNGKPYHLWAHPDNVEGVLNLLAADRALTPQGIYDYKVLGNVHALVSNAVGGGSMIYSNVTIEPPMDVYKTWFSDESEALKLQDYFKKAKNFIKINKIVSNAGMSANLLEKTKALKEAAQALIDKGNTDIVNVTKVGNKASIDFPVDLSITDIPPGLIPADLQDRMKNNALTDADKAALPDIMAKLSQSSVCQRQGRCNLGCIPGSRHTLNKSLYDAVKSGNPANPLEIRELSEVYDIQYEEGKEFPYKVLYRLYGKTENGSPELKEVSAKKVVIAAGTLGSTELLLKCKERGSLDLSDQVGKNFLTNGDFLGYMTLEQRTIDSTRGPINASHVAFKTEGKEFTYTIEDTTISKMVAPLVATMLELHAHGAREANMDLLKDAELLIRFGLSSLIMDNISTTTLMEIFSKMWNDPNVRGVLIDILRTGTATDETTRKLVESILTWAVTDWDNPYASPEERMARFFVFSAMSRGEKAGMVKLKPNWKEMEDQNDLGEKIFVDWPAAENTGIFKSMVEGMKSLAANIEIGGEDRVFTPLWNFDNPEESTTVVLHPLGGCSIGKDVTVGVVDNLGHVFRNDGSSDKKKAYPDLYVIDGSIIPEPLGVNPSFTISALAFRAAENIVGAKNLP
jgi:Choline dehydrogenase and related flavoproteins